MGHQLTLQIRATASTASWKMSKSLLYRGEFGAWFNTMPPAKWLSGDRLARMTAKTSDWNVFRGIWQ